MYKNVTKALNIVEGNRILFIPLQRKLESKRSVMWEDNERELKFRSTSVFLLEFYFVLISLVR